MASDELERLGLGVAKCTVRTSEPAVMDVSYYGARQVAPAAQRIRFRSDGAAITFPGHCTLHPAEGGDPLELDVARTGAHGFALTVLAAGQQAARGIGLIDPDDPESLLVSWWTGEVEPYGIVKYAIRDDRTIEGYYISKMSPDQPGSDIAIGDTRGGFPGSYVLNSREVNGRTWGPHQWVLTARGGLIDFAWSEHGKVFCRGLGIVDPHDSSATIATYIAL